MIVMRREIGGEFVEISLGNCSCDSQEFFPDGHKLPLGLDGRCPYPAGTCMRSISFPGCCHGLIIAKSNRWHKEATKNKKVPGCFSRYWRACQTLPWCGQRPPRLPPRMPR